MQHPQLHAVRPLGAARKNALKRKEALLVHSVVVHTEHQRGGVPWGEQRPSGGCSQSRISTQVKDTLALCLASSCMTSMYPSRSRVL